MHFNHIGFISEIWGWFSICKSVSVRNNRLLCKNKRSIKISIDAKKVFKKNSTYFHDKVLEYLKGIYLK